MKLTTAINIGVILVIGLCLAGSSAQAQPWYGYSTIQVNQDSGYITASAFTDLEYIIDDPDDFIYDDPSTFWVHVNATILGTDEWTVVDSETDEGYGTQ